MSASRRLDIDFLKGISIIAVVLYHIGLLPYGYLGVDTFLVISGFLTIPPIIKSISENNFSYFEWLAKRIYRFIPLLIIALLCCLSIGYFTMIPDDYENLSEAVVASSIFCENILSAITTKNYWNAINEYKPLMHLWYLGIIIQFYALCPLILLCIKQACRHTANIGNKLSTTVFIMTLISFLCFIWPQFSFNEKFYYLPFRMWEFGIGGLIGITVVSNNLSISKTVYFSVLAVLIGCFCCCFKSLSQINNITIIGFNAIDSLNISKDILLITVVAMSALLLLYKSYNMRGWIYTALGFIGKMSFSIFIWHQILLAFLRYAIVDEMTLPVFMTYMVAVLVISYLSYIYIESIKIDTLARKVSYLSVWISIIVISLLIYKNAGVVRDVPELDITMEHPYVSRNTEYIDRIYSYKKPFTTDKPKILVVGNSFARDFASCLLEWDNDDSLELSYMFDFHEADDRIKECDYLFCFGLREDVPHYIWHALKPDCKVYGIGTKNYGKSFGRIYARRYKDDYYNSTIPIHPKLQQTNEKFKNSWGEQNYIDFVKASTQDNGQIRLFTPDNKIISFDCQHLTKFGCKFLSTQLHFDEIFMKNIPNN